jgi:hypothetical protein
VLYGGPTGQGDLKRRAPKELVSFFVFVGETKNKRRENGNEEKECAYHRFCGQRLP